MSKEKLETEKAKEYLVQAEELYVTYTKDLEQRNSAVKSHEDPREAIVNLARLLFDLQKAEIDTSIAESLKELAAQRKLPEIPKHD